MSAKRNKATAERWVEKIWNRGDMSALDAIVSPDLVLHRRVNTDVQGHAGLKQAVSDFRSGLPDGHFTVDEMIAEGDKLVVRWTLTGTHRGAFAGVAATGKRSTTTGTTTLRFAGGKVAEYWAHWDGLGWLQQIGKTPA